MPTPTSSLSLMIGRRLRVCVCVVCGGVRCVLCYVQRVSMCVCVCVVCGGVRSVRESMHVRVKVSRALGISDASAHACSGVHRLAREGVELARMINDKEVPECMID